MPCKHLQCTSFQWCNWQWYATFFAFIGGKYEKGTFCFKITSGLSFFNNKIGSHFLERYIPAMDFCPTRIHICSSKIENENHTTLSIRYSLFNNKYPWVLGGELPDVKGLRRLWLLSFVAKDLCLWKLCVLPSAFCELSPKLSPKVSLKLSFSSSIY